MRVLTNSEAEEFCANQQCLASWNPHARSTEGWSSRPLPKDSGSKNYLARFLADIFYEESSDIVLQVSDWSIWPSSDNPELFRQYREFLGERRPLIEASFQVFAAEEGVEFRNLLNLCLLFFYDASVKKISNGDEVFVSHDEYIDFNFVDREKQQALEKWFDE